MQLLDGLWFLFQVQFLKPIYPGALASTQDLIEGSG